MRKRRGKEREKSGGRKDVRKKKRVFKVREEERWGLRE